MMENEKINIYLLLFKPLLNVQSADMAFILFKLRSECKT